MYIKTFCLLFLFLFLLCFRNLNCNNKIKAKYNFGKKQNYKIDLLYKHLLGCNLYFLTLDTKDTYKTIYSIILYPSTSLIINFKMYTNDNYIISNFNSGKILFFGLDLNISNTDISLTQYNTDSIICFFDNNNAECHDYVFDKNEEKYKINDNEYITNNNLIPIGFNDIKLNILTEDVIDFTNYYQISVEKQYSINFDNVTMFNWINSVASAMGYTVNGFYGFKDNLNDIENIKTNECYLLNNINFKDGAGLEDNSKINKIHKIFIILFSIFLL